MPAKSVKQQKLMGMVHAAQKGAEPASAKVAQLAKTMSKKSATEFAATKHKGLPAKKKKLKEGELDMVYVVKKPYAGCELTDLVKPIDPLVGLAGSSIVPQDVHSTYLDQAAAMSMATELHADHEKQSVALEEKKDMVGKKITQAIDALEKKRKEHVTMAKEDPRNAIEHKEKIADLASKIDDLMDKLARVEKSKKNEEKKEAKINENKTLNESGYVLAMNPIDLQPAIDKIVEIWTEWKNGPATKSSDITPAKTELLTFIEKQLK